MMEEGKRIDGQHLIKLISDSKTSDLSKLKTTDHINCYAFARHLTYPDPCQEFYIPGTLFHIKNGYGDCIDNFDVDPNFIDECIQNDSKAIGQTITRMSIDEIQNDGHYYFGIAKFTLALHKSDDPAIRRFSNLNDSQRIYLWHFIVREPSGIWLHKPNYIQPVEKIKWEEYGKSFFANVYNYVLEAYTPCEYTCFSDFFYRVET